VLPALRAQHQLRTPGHRVAKALPAEFPTEFAEHRGDLFPYLGVPARGNQLQQEPREVIVARTRLIVARTRLIVARTRLIVARTRLIGSGHRRPFPEARSVRVGMRPGECSLRRDPQAFPCAFGTGEEEGTLT